MVGQSGHMTILSSCSGGYGADIELRHRQGALPEGCADAVGGGIAAADHHHMLARGDERAFGGNVFPADPPVALDEEGHGVMRTIEIHARKARIARPLGAARQQHRIIDIGERAEGTRDADIDIEVEGDALGLHLRDAPVDRMLLHLEVGNAVAQKAAGLGIAFENMHLMAGARQLLGGGEAG